jgi:S-adenosylmethionine uptake transporter
MPPAPLPTGNVLTGIGLASAGYACFALQDATVKWLVASYSVPQILFLRSVVIVAMCLVFARVTGATPFWKSRNLTWLVLRAVVLLGAWLCYYAAARSLGLAEMTTLYFVAPILVVVLSIVVLREKVTPARWLAVIAGFAGVLVVADPSQRPDLLPAFLVLIAALLWALSVVMVRVISRNDSTFSVMAVSSLFFAVVCGAMQPFVWHSPDLTGWVLIIGFSIASAFGQYLVYEGFRYAPASALAPVEYTGLVWAFFYGYLIWADVPSIKVFAGAALIVSASLGLVWWERRIALGALRS